MARQPQGRQAKSQARQQAFYSLRDRAAATASKMGTMDAVDPGAARMGDIAVELTGVTLTRGTTTVLRDFSYSFAKGERVAIVGPNGAGKTSMLRLCLGLLPPDSGQVKIGETVRFGHYAQMVSWEDESLRVAEYVQQVAADAREGGLDGEEWTGSNLIKRFQFNERQRTLLRDLSGGEKRRLSLLAALAARPNYLILDEPTNDLDMASTEALEALLQSFEGIIVITGHDRTFIDNIADHILVLDGAGGVTDWVGSFTSLRAEQKRTAAAAASAVRASALPKAGAAKSSALEKQSARSAALLPASSKDAKRAASNASKKLPKLEAALEKLLEEVAALNRQLEGTGSDAALAIELVARRDETEKKANDVFMEMELLEEIVNAAAAE